MLARLEELDGIESAQTDVAGALLRVAARDARALAAALDRLASLGYAAETDAERTVVDRWYDTTSVGDLSRAESLIIAARVAAHFDSAHGPTTADPVVLRAAIADALHRCFVTTALGAGPSSGEFRLECVRSVIAATRPLVGSTLADHLGALTDEDMRAAHDDPPRA